MEEDNKKPGRTEQMLEVTKFIRATNQRAREEKFDYPVSVLAFAADRPFTEDGKKKVGTDVLRVVRYSSIDTLVHVIAQTILDDPQTFSILKEAFKKAASMAKDSLEIEEAEDGED